ncbi:hypothetical protein [Desulfovibrio sp. G11]|nr:hypothetical protein [Desulfovibrio sp. G11]
MKEDILVQPVVVFVPIVMENILTDNFFLSPHFMPPGVGDVHMDRNRNAIGQINQVSDGHGTPTASGMIASSVTSNTKFTTSDGSDHSWMNVGIDLSRVMPVGASIAPRAWGALACCYLGTPA